MESEYCRRTGRIIARFSPQEAMHVTSLIGRVSPAVHDDADVESGRLNDAVYRSIHDLLEELGHTYRYGPSIMRTPMDR